MGTPDQQTPNKLGEIDLSLPAEDKTPPGRSLGNLKRRSVDLGDDCGDDEKDNASGNGKVMKSYKYHNFKHYKNQGGVYYRSYHDWVAYVEQNFEEIICGGKK